MGLLIILAAAVTLAWLLWAILPTCYHKYLRRHLLRRQNGAERVLLLSFDDGPDPRYTPQLLDLLHEYGIPANFFVSGSAAAAAPQLIHRMQEEGHCIGLHGYRHANQWLLGPKAAARELTTGLVVLRGLGIEPCAYRPPYGNLTLYTLWLLRKHNLRLTLWSVMAQDWRGDTAEAILQRLRRRCRPGSIICLHDGCAGTAVADSAAATIEALRSFLPEMQAAGYRFLRLSEIKRADDPCRTEVLYGEA